MIRSIISRRTVVQTGMAVATAPEAACASLGGEARLQAVVSGPTHRTTR